jgi:serine/threonine-protein kinase
MDVAAGVACPWGLVWGDDQTVFYGTETGPIWRVTPGQAAEAVTTVGESEITHALPFVLPGGRVLLYTVRKRLISWGDEEVVAQPLASRERRTLLRDAADARYLPSGHLVFLRRGQLFAVAFDPVRLEVKGAEVPLLGGVAQGLTGVFNSDRTGAGQFSVSTAGTLAWLPNAAVGPGEDAAAGHDSQPVVVDRRGTVTPLAMPPKVYGTIRVSPDGRQLAATILGLRSVGLWVVADLTRPTPLTPVKLDGEVRYAQFAWLPPDGQRLVFGRIKDGNRSLMVQPASGSGDAETILAGDFIPSSFTADGHKLAAVQGDRDIVVLALDNGQWRMERLPRTGGAEFSPDGHWLAYGASVEDLGWQVYVRPHPGSGAGLPVSQGNMPVWNPNGRELFFLTGDRMFAAAFDPGPPPRVGTPHPLFDINPQELVFGGVPARVYAVAPDGNRFYALKRTAPPVAPVVTHINLIQNWFEELKAKVPVQ